MEVPFYWRKQKEESKVLGLIHLGRLRAKQDQDAVRSCFLIMFCFRVSLIQVVMLNRDVGLVELAFFFFF